MEFYHDNLTKNDLSEIRVYRLRIKYYPISRKYGGETHDHYFESAIGGLLVYLIKALIEDILEIESIEIKRV